MRISGLICAGAAGFFACFPAGAGETVVTRDGKTLKGKIACTLFGVEIDNDTRLLWSAVRKMTNDKGQVLFEGPETLTPEVESGIFADTGEIRGSAYVNASLGLTAALPSGEDVRTRVRKVDDKAAAGGNIAPDIERYAVLTVEIAVQPEKLRNRAVAEAFQRFPCRVLILAHPGFSGVREDSLLRRLTEDTTRRQVEGWVPEVARSNGKFDAKVKERTLGGQPSLSFRGSIKELGATPTGYGKVVRNLREREREVEVITSRRRDAALLVLTEIAAPDELADSIRQRLRKFVASIRFD
jgi:hypothetical protein